jgi:hypothetical protein
VFSPLNVILEGMFALFITVKDNFLGVFGMGNLKLASTQCTFLYYTVPGNKDENYPTSSFKQIPISPFTITILCDAQSTLYSCVISINRAKFHSRKTKTPFVMNFFISFSLFYVKIDQETSDLLNL